MLFGFGILTVVAILVGTGLFIWHLRSAAISDAQRQLSNLSKVLAEQSNSTIQPVDLFLLDALSLLHTGGPMERPAQGKAFHDVLRTRVASMPYVLSIFVLDANGAGAFSSRSHPTPGVHAGNRSYFIAHKTEGAAGLFISEPRRNRLSPDKWSFFLSRNFKGPGGDLKAVVVASIDLDYFENLYATINLPSETSIALLHREGVVLASHPHSDAAIGRSYGSPSHFARLLTESEGANRTVENENVDSDGSEQRALLTSNSELRGYPLLVSVSIPLHAALAGWQNQSIIIGSAAAVLGLIIALLARIIHAGRMI